MRGPSFTLTPSDGGYLWWYVDVVSDDESLALTLIAFLGSVFSPRYFAARRDHGDTRALAHAAFNVVLYAKRQGRWTLTDWPEAAVSRSPDALVIGPNECVWRGDSLEVSFDECGAPRPRRLAGRLTLRPDALVGQPITLDAGGVQTWWPIAPLGTAEVVLSEPRLSFSGHAYHDANSGLRPLEASFRDWQWARLRRGGDAIVLYDTRSLAGDHYRRGFRFDRSGRSEDWPEGEERSLGRTLWAMPRSLRVPAGDTVRVARTLEDTPFYARTLLRGTLGGETATGIHESLSLARFVHPAVQWMLPYRIRQGTWPQ